MRSADVLWRYAVCIGVAVILIRLLGPEWQTGFASPFPDSSSYLAVADAGPLSPDFWFGERPPTYPFLIWLVGPAPRPVIVVQTLVAVLAWGWLVSTACTTIRSRPVAIVVSILLIGIAIQTRWMLWHTALLTESLSASLAVAGVAAWWRWWSDPDRFRTVVAVAITVAWMLLRDSNAATLFAVAAPALVVVFVMKRRRPSVRRRWMGVSLAVLLVTGAYSLSAQAATDRGETSFHNNVGLRWLPDADMAAWMEARGMPISRALVARTGKDAWADGEAMLRAPELAEYRAWADGRGRVAAVSSFVVRADWYGDRFLTELPLHTATDYGSYDTYGVATYFPERPLGWFDPVGSRPALIAWFAISAAAIGFLFVRRRTMGWMGLFLLAPVVADLYLSFAADAIEVSRHLAGPMQRFAVVTVIVAALAADELVAGSPSGDATPSDVGDTADSSYLSDSIDAGVVDA